MPRFFERYPWFILVMGVLIYVYGHLLIMEADTLHGASALNIVFFFIGMFAGDFLFIVAVAVIYAAAVIIGTKHHMTPGLAMVSFGIGLIVITVAIKPLLLAWYRR